MAIDKELGGIKEHFTMYLLAAAVAVCSFMLWVSHNNAARKADELIREIHELRQSLDKLAERQNK